MQNFKDKVDKNFKLLNKNSFTNAANSALKLDESLLSNANDDDDSDDKLIQLLDDEVEENNINAFYQTNNNNINNNLNGDNGSFPIEDNEDLNILYSIGDQSLLDRAQKLSLLAGQEKQKEKRPTSSASSNNSASSFTLLSDFLQASKHTINKRLDAFASNLNNQSNQTQLSDDIPMLNPSYAPASEDDSHHNHALSTKYDSDFNLSDRKAHRSCSLDRTTTTTTPNGLLLSDHCHVFKLDDRDKKQNAIVWRKLIIVLVLCTLFMVGEIVGGLLAKSIAIQTDAAHMAADIAGFFFSIVAIYVAGKEPTKRMSFGYYRSEILGALFSTLVIWILTGCLVYLAILRCIDQSFEIESVAMLTTASCGVVFNIIMYIVLHTNVCFKGLQLGHHHGHSHSGDGHTHAHAHSHSHGHSHAAARSGSKSLTHNDEISIPINDQFSIADDVPIVEESDQQVEINDRNNINLRAAAIHVIGDFVQSIGVLVAAIIIHIKPEFKLADPICTFIFSFLVILTTAPIIRDIYYVLMEALPANVTYESVIRDLCRIPHVKRAHNLHIWCLTMDKIALSVHVAIEKNADTQEVLREANYLLRTKYNIERTTIQVEYFIESMDNCLQCQLPDK